VIARVSILGHPLLPASFQDIGAVPPKKCPESLDTVVFGEYVQVKSKSNPGGQVQEVSKTDWSNGSDLRNVNVEGTKSQ